MQLHEEQEKQVHCASSTESILFYWYCNRVPSDCFQQEQSTVRKEKKILFLAQLAHNLQQNSKVQRAVHKLTAPPVKLVPLHIKYKLNSY